MIVYWLKQFNAYYYNRFFSFHLKINISIAFITFFSFKINISIAFITMSKVNPIILSDIETISDDETISENEYSESIDEQVCSFIIFFKSGLV